MQSLVGDHVADVVDRLDLGRIGFAPGLACAGIGGLDQHDRHTNIAQHRSEIGRHHLGHRRADRVWIGLASRLSHSGKVGLSGNHPGKRCPVLLDVLFGGQVAHVLVDLSRLGSSRRRGGVRVGKRTDIRYPVDGHDAGQ